MTQKEATEIKDWAKPTIEAVQAIAKSVERRCRHCEGIGFLKGNPAHKCSKCNGTGKVKGKWEWKPEAGNEFIDNFNEYFWGHRCVILSIDPVSFRCWDYDEGCQRYTSKDAVSGMIPLFPMEKLEEILEGMGYSFSIDEPPHGETPDYRLAEHFIWVFDKSKVIARGKGKTRQQALRLAVIELGEVVERWRDNDSL